MIDTLTFGLCHFDSSRNRKELCDTLSEEIGCGVWYETFTAVNTDWLWLIEKLLKALYTDNYACAVVGLYPAYIAGVLPGFEDEINIYIATSRLSELDIRKYINDALSSKTCTVLFVEEGKQVRIVIDEKSVTVNFISQCANNAPANFSLNMLLYMFRNLDKVNMSYGIICFNAQISYVFDSICNSKFVCAEAPSDTFFEPLKKMIQCKVPKNTRSDNHIPNDYTFCNIQSHSDKTKTVQCKCILCRRQPPTLRGLCLEALELSACRSVYHKVV
jgi:hypothetical protein